MRRHATLLGQFILCLVLAGLAGGCGPANDPKENAVNEPQPTQAGGPTEVATFGGGCFWCVEAVFEELDGVVSVESGYSGGNVENPTYEQVSTGATDHAEVCQIHYDPAKISYPDLLQVFWKTHDPTTLDRQGNDVGTQYRSVIFYHNDAQKAAAEQMKRRLDASGLWARPIVTQISPFQAFFKAEAYHQDYFRRNPERAYCRAVIRPKIEKFRKEKGSGIGD